MVNGDVARAGTSMRKMQEAAATSGNPGIIGLSDAFLARFSVIHGDLEWAEQWAEKRRFLRDGDEPFSLRFFPECMAQSQLCYARQRYEEAARLLIMLREQCVEHDMMEGLLEADLLYSAVLYGMGDLKEARRVMEEAVRFAETEGYVRVFVNRSPIISPILVDMAGRRPKRAESSYLSVIAKACGVDESESPYKDEGKRGNTLTSREVEILRLIAGGCRNKEIAEKAHISLDTVRTHTSHIFQKLEVETRVQAIRKAEELGIIGSPETASHWTFTPKMISESTRSSSRQASLRSRKNHTKV
jgi:LuxR family transcriptional regulator, maltose regulon positive regulatory protein